MFESWQEVFVAFFVGYGVYAFGRDSLIAVGLDFRTKEVPNEQ
jgi:hypothetical protein